MGSARTAGRVQQGRASATTRVAALRRRRTPYSRIEAATAMLEALRCEANEVSRIREAAIVELHDSGLSYGEIAQIAHVSRARVAQIVRHSESADG